MPENQVWRGINAAKVLVAELTTRDANVFYELGLAHPCPRDRAVVRWMRDGSKGYSAATRIGGLAPCISWTAAAFLDR
jgi:hypothetical protein